MSGTTPTMSVKVREWAEPLEDGRTEEDWPAPDQHVEYRITGNLADLIRARTGENGDVIFDEVTIEGGYSEYTVEYAYEVTIRVGGFTRRFDGQVEFAGGYYSAIPGIQRWLEQPRGLEDNHD